MTVTLADHPTWPDGDPGKVLLNCNINTNVDETFEELFGSYPETQAKLHKQRNDTNCAESPWVPQRSQLPAQQFVWPAPPAGADPGTPAQGKYRKVRFEAAASMASKAFSSEEVQRVVAYSPGSHYQLETEVYTTAMYGDTFTVISRYTLAGKGPGKTHLHVLYAIAFKPTLSRLMKPMVAKGVDGGIRGSFSVLKKLLQDQYGLSDLPETAPPPSVPGAPAAAAEVAAAPAAAAQVPALLGPAAPAPGLLALADYVVYQDLVASLVQVSDPQLIAKALAMCLTLVLIHVCIMVLRPISQACAAAAASGSGILSWLCWPLSVGLDIPDSLGEVLGALLLVAVANKLLLLGVELAAGALKGSPSPSVAASRAPSMLGAALSAVAAAASSGQHPSAATAPTNGNLAPAAGSAAAQAAAAATTGAGSQSQQGRPPLSPRQQKSSPVAIPSKAANGSGGGGGGGSGGGVEAALSNFSNAVTGWGRNLLGAGVVDSFSSNEGLKALVTGPWSKSNENLKANDAGQGPGSTPAATSEGAARLSSAGSGRGRAPSHRHTNSFTTVMDPSGLNIIEDYDQQLLRNPSQETVGQLPRLVEEQSAATSPATSEVGHAGPFAAAAAAGSKGVADNEAKGGKAAAAEALRAAERSASGRSAGSSPARSGSPSKQLAGRSSSPSKMKRAGSSKKALSEADVEARQPLLSALSGDGSVGQPSSQAGSTTQQQGPGQGTSRPSTPVPGDDGPVPPLLDSASPIVTRGAHNQAHNARTSKSVTFSRSPHTPDSTSGPLAASHSAAAMLAGASKSAGGVVGSSAANSTRSSPLARRSASPMLYGASPPTDGGSAADSPNIGRLGMSGMSASYEALSASSGSSGVGAVPAVEPGQEDADEVLVEVFEHERVQPFRGWGHTWPGHFLPSDKVGHWGDRSGAPGGAVSMLFDRVAPKLPPGWTWLDPEWTVDMTGAEWEGCDTDGWSYGMDFSWITYPPGPQMGKPGLKSFVRRRRWVRMRARLAPGAEAPEEQSQQGSPVLASQLESMQQQSSSAPNSARDSDGGFMAGLSTGLGLVSNESASAAAAAAGAMVSRFMKAVQDLPLAPRGSSGGSELGLGTSPPTVSTAPDAAKGQQRLVSAAAAAGSKDTAAGTAAQEEQGGGSVREVGLDVGSKQQQQQQQQQAVISSKSRNAGSSRRGGDRGNVSDSDSSSVNSDSPPPRPRLSEALAELRQDQAAGLTQADAAEAAAVASAAAAAGKEEQSGVAAEPPVAKAGSSSTAAMQAEAAAPAATKDDSGSSALKEPSAGAEAGKAAPTSAAAGAAVKGTAVAATAPTAVEEPPQEGLPAGQASVKQHPAPTAPREVQAAAPQTPAAVVAPAAEAPASAAKDGAGQVADSEQATASKAAVAAAEGEQAAPAAAAAAAATAAEKPRSAGADSKQKQQQVKVEAVPASGADTGAVSAPTDGAQDVGSGSTDAALAAASRLIPTSSTGGSSAVGSGDWVWSAAEAAAAGTEDTPRSTLRAAQQQQTPLETVGGSGELPSSPLSVDSPTSPTQLRGSGVVNRTSSGGAGRGIVRTGSGARGGRGKQSKLGAVPLRRSGEGSTGGDTTRSSGAGTATSSAVGAGLASAAPSAAVSGGSSAAAAGSSSASRAQPPPPPPAAAAAAGAATAGEPAPALAAAGASTSQQSAEAAVLAHVSGDDMGSGLGWPSSPDKQGLPSMQEDRGEGGKPTGADGQQKGAGQKSWDEW